MSSPPEIALVTLKDKQTKISILSSFFNISSHDGKTEF